MKNSIDLTVILFSKATVSRQELQEYAALGNELIVAGPLDKSIKHDATNCKCDWVEQHKDESKTAVLNRAVSQANGKYILWIDAGEKLDSIPSLDDEEYAVALVQQTGLEHTVSNRQIRLFPNVSGLEFQGTAIPSIYPAVIGNGWERASRPLNIERPVPLFSVEDIEREVHSGKTGTATHTFWKAMLATEKEQYGQAIDLLYKLQVSDLSAWNELAAYNTLANNYIETHQLDKAKKYAELSRQKSARQRAPYLTLYQYCNFKGMPREAYKYLSLYIQMASAITDANWDVFLPKPQAAFLLANLALKQGQHQRAYHHYEVFYRLNGGEVSENVLEKLFIYAVELQEREKARRYFEDFFGGQLPDELSERQTAWIRDALALFADKGWYDYASEIYQQLVARQPENDALRHGWIRTLVKNDEISKAQALL